MRLTIIVLIGVLVAGSIVISVGFLTNQNEDSASPVIASPYEKLEKYKNELERINQYNQDVLEQLEEQIKSSTEDESFDQIKEEIQVIKRVIDENKAELEDVIKKLSEMSPDQ